MHAILTEAEVAELFAIRLKLTEFYDRIRAAHAVTLKGQTVYPTALKGHDTDGTNVYEHLLTRDDGPGFRTSFIYTMSIDPNLKPKKS